VNSPRNAILLARNANLMKHDTVPLAAMLVGPSAWLYFDPCVALRALIRLIRR